jgi:hypothetical protein
MERVSLSSLVGLAKQMAGDLSVYRPGMTIIYQLQERDHEILQREVYEYANKTDRGYTSKKKFEFEVMDINFVFNKISG